VINKIDLAKLVGANLETMKKDAEKIRKEKPFEFINCKTDQGVKEIVDHIIHDVLFDLPPKSIHTEKVQS
jgi:urease accessory protein